MTKGKDLFARLNDLLLDIGPGELDNDQDNFVLFLDLARRNAWDLPSALGCDHDIFDRTEFPNFDITPMHREPQSYWDGLNPWPIIDRHFAEVHSLDLTDKRINWSFDT